MLSVARRQKHGEQSFHIKFLLRQQNIIYWSPKATYEVFQYVQDFNCFFKHNKLLLLCFHTKFINLWLFIILIYIINNDNLSEWFLCSEVVMDSKPGVKLTFFSCICVVYTLLKLSYKRHNSDSFQSEKKCIYYPNERTRI